MKKFGVIRITQYVSYPLALACFVASSIGITISNATACSALEPAPPAVTAEDVETVEARLADLSSRGITIPQDVETPPPQTHMTGATLAVDSKDGFAGGYGEWALILADGLERVEFHFTCAPEEEGYTVFDIRRTNGQWLFSPGEGIPETFAVEFGNVLKFVDPMQARLDLDIKILEALDAAEQPEIDPKFAQRLTSRPKASRRI